MAKTKFRSNFEELVATNLKHRRVKYEYEPEKWDFVQPAQKRKYCPDFKLSNGVYVECKGRLTAADRKKMLLVKEQYPKIRLVMLFQRAKNTLTKRSKTTYGDWCDKHGIEWADWEKGIPTDWIKK